MLVTTYLVYHTVLLKVMVVTIPYCCNCCTYAFFCTKALHPENLRAELSFEDTSMRKVHLNDSLGAMTGTQIPKVEVLPAMADDEVCVVSPVQAGLQSFAGTSLDFNEALPSFRSPSESSDKHRKRRKHGHKISNAN